MRRSVVTAALVGTAFAVASCTPSTGTDPGTRSGTGTGTATAAAPPTTDPEATTRAESDATTTPGTTTGPGTTADTDGVADPTHAPLDLAVVEVDGLTALVAPPAGPGGDTAQVSGELVTGPGGCFAIAVEGSPPVLVVWPDGTEVEPGARPQVDAPGVGVISVGQRLEHAGGFVPRDAFDVPERCLDGSAPEVAVLNAG